MASKDPLKDLFSSKGSFYFIELEKIKVEEGFNARKDFGDIPGLAKDIAANGLTQPLVVRVAPDKSNTVIIIDGERRLRALNYINEHNLAADGNFYEAKCIIEEKTNEEVRLLRVFSTGANSKPLTELEQADVVYRLKNNYNWSIRLIAEKVGRTQVVVSHLLELHSASFEVREAVRTKKISPTAARVLTKAPKETQKKILEKAKAGKAIKVRDVEKDLKGTSTQISSKTMKDKIKRIEALIKAKKVDAKEYHSIIRGVELALGFWELP